MVVQRDGGGAADMQVRGRIDIEGAQQLLDEMSAHLAGVHGVVRLDLSGVNYFDSGGGAVVIALRQRLAGDGVELKISGSTPAIDGFLSLVDEEALLHPPHPVASRRISITTRLGGETLKVLSDFRKLVVFTGELILGPFPADTYADPATGLCTVTPSATANVTLACIRLSVS